MRFAAFLILVSFVAPVGAAQTAVGRVTIDVLPAQLTLTGSDPSFVTLWVNMTIDCDTGTYPSSFPTIEPVHPDDVHPPWDIEPERFNAAGPFEMSAWTPPGLYEYADEVALEISVQDPAAAPGWGNLTWTVMAATSGVGVPPDCSAGGYTWTLDRASTLLIEYKRLDQAPTSQAPNLTAPANASNTTIESGPFIGEGRTPEDAFVALGLGVLAFVALMGFAGRMRRVR